MTLLERPAAAPPATLTPDDVRRIQGELQRFLLEYDFGLREVETKISILSDEFRHMHDYNPIEHVSCRVKTADSIFAKATPQGAGAGPGRASASTSATSPASA